MNLRPEEISSVIKEEIKKYSTEFEVDIQATAPAPPTRIAAATPRIFPVPSEPASDAVKD